MGAASTAATAVNPAWVTGAFTLAGAFLGASGLWLLERSRRFASRQQWLLDRRHESYVQILDLLFEADHATHAWFRAGDPDRQKELKDSLDRTVAQLQSAWNRLQLVAPTRTSVLMANIMVAVVQLADRLESDTDLPESPSYYQSDVDRTTMLFVRHIEQELQGDGRPWNRKPTRWQKLVRRLR